MLIIKPYNRARAVEYARRWAMERNPLFIDFTGRGGDCTSFVSQSILAGGCVMDMTPTFGWYYVNSADRAPAWSGVEYFYDYMTGSGDFPPSVTHIGPFGVQVVDMAAREGDVVQLADDTGDFYHSLVITGFSGGDILVSAHSDDALDRPLSSYNYASRRIIHIVGFRVDYPDDACFEDLIEGRALRGITM
ncbi:MAG: amidase domain-containing protein [Clostridia bacterium]|nr:amidase domain-containing protein [Clostridia bacterium]